MTDVVETGRDSKIEITPEMIEAGADVVRGYSSQWGDEEWLAEAVFIAMLTRKAIPADQCNIE